MSAPRRPQAEQAPGMPQLENPYRRFFTKTPTLEQLARAAYAREKAEKTEEITETAENLKNLKNSQPKR